MFKIAARDFNAVRVRGAQYVLSFRGHVKKFEFNDSNINVRGYYKKYTFLFHKQKYELRQR